MHCQQVLLQFTVMLTTFRILFLVFICKEALYICQYVILGGPRESH